MSLPDGVISWHLTLEWGVSVAQSCMPLVQEQHDFRGCSAEITSNSSRKETLLKRHFHLPQVLIWVLGGVSVFCFLPANNPITGSVLLQASVTNEIQIKLDFQLPSRYE